MVCCDGIFPLTAREKEGPFSLTVAKSRFHSSSLGGAASSANALVTSIARTLAGLENLMISAVSYPPLQKKEGGTHTCGGFGKVKSPGHPAPSTKGVKGSQNPRPLAQNARRAGHPLKYDGFERMGQPPGVVRSRLDDCRTLVSGERIILTAFILIQNQVSVLYPGFRIFHLCSR